MRKLLAIALSAAILVSSASPAFGALAAEETTTADQANANELRLWYDKPTSEGTKILSAGAFNTTEEENTWQQFTLPIGNGHIGANVYGEISNEHLTFNEQTLWTGGPSDSRPDYNGGNLEVKGKNGETFREIQRLFAEGKDSEASALCNQLTGASDGYGAYQAWGDIYFDFDYDQALVSNYTRDLDLKTAVASVDFDYGATNYRREYLTSNPANVLAIRFTAEGGGTLDFDVRFPFKGTNAAAVASGDTLTLSGELADNQMKYYSQLKVVPKGGGTVTAGDGKLTVAGATQVEIYVAAETDYKNDYPAYRSGESMDDLKNQVEGRVNAAVEDGYEKVKAAHIADYQNIFNRVELDLGQQASQKPTDELLASYKNGTATDAEDRDLEVMLFQYGRYLTIASSREDSELPSNLQGLWNNRVNNVPWSSDYHMNVNLQMNYWPTYVTNMAECAIPLENYVDSLREPGRVTAKTYFGVESTEENPENGFTAHTQNTPFGWTCPGWDFSWGWSPAAVPWILQNCYEYYEYTGDKEYLRDKIYPMLREEAILYDQILVWDEESQRMVSSPTYSPEHGPRTVGNTYEQTLIWQLYEDAITAAETLGVDADKVAQWKDTQSKLDPIQIGDSGQIKEWYEETTLGSIGERGHRHMSHLLGLYPGDLISVDTPEWMEAAIVSLKDRGLQTTGWGMGQRINAWARTGDGNQAYELIRTLFNSGIYPNLWDAHPPFQIDGNFGMTSGVAEMLLQSNMGYINILPALPDAWADGSLSGLVARGNFEVSMRWADKHATRVEILSNNGGECVVNYPQVSLANITKADGTPVETTAISTDRISFESEQGETYVINNIPKSAAQIAAPEGLRASRADSDTVNVSWNAVAGEGVVYNVYRQINDGAFRRVASGLESARFTDGQADEILGVISYKVAAVVDGVEGSLSDAAAVEDLRGVVTIDDRNENIVYEGGWGTWDDGSHINGTIHFKEVTEGGESITYTFEGTGIKVISPKNPNFGYMDVYIDDMETPVAKNVDFYASSSLKQQETYVNMDLAPGTHTIKLVATGTKNPASSKTKIEFDAFIIYNGESTTVSDISVGTKTGASTIGGAGGTLQMTANLSPENAAMQEVAWSVSDESIATIDENGLLTAKDKAGSVTVTASAKDASGVTGSKEITVQLPYDKETIIDDKDTEQIHYSENWQEWPDDKHYGGSIHFSEGNNSVGQTIELSFSGTGIEVYTPKNATFGGYNIYLDGKLVNTVDLYSDTAQGEAQQMIFEKKGLQNGAHTIKLEIIAMRGKTKAEFDYFKVTAPSSSVDKSALQKTLQEVDGLTSSLYTQESWASLEEALREAVAAMDDPDATQQETENAVELLEEAILGLEEAEDDEPPTDPSGLAAIGVDETTLMLKWDAAADNIGVTGYRVLNGSQELGWVTGCYYRVSGLKENTEYRFTVKAVDAAGNESEGAVLTVTTAQAPDTEAPVMGSVTVEEITDTTAHVFWETATDATGIAGYEVYLNGVLMAKTADTSYDLTGLNAAESYTVKVRAYDAAGNYSLPVGKLFTTTAGAVENEATVTGVVLDTDNTPVEGAAVTLSSSSRALPETVVTTAQGEYTFTGVPYGSYLITAEKDGYQTASITVTVDSDTVAADSILLKPDSVPGAVDTKELQKVIAAAERMVADYDLYVEQGKDILNAALERARAAAEAAASQQAVDTAKTELLDAIDGLRFKADKSTLQAFLDKLAGIDLTLYTEESAMAFRTVLAEAQELLTQDLSTDQAALLADMQEKLQTAQENLIPLSKEGTSEEENISKSENKKQGGSEASPEDGKPSNPQSGTGAAAATGDTSNITLYIILGVAAVVLIVVGAILIRKRNKSDK